MKVSSSLSFPFQFHFTDSVVSFELSLEPKKRKLYSNSSRVMNFRPLVLIFFYKDTYILQYNLMIIWQLFVAKKCVEIFMHQQCKGKEHRMAREHGEKSSWISKKCETWIFFFFSFPVQEDTIPKRLGNLVYVCVVVFFPRTCSSFKKDKVTPFSSCLQEHSKLCF